MVSTFLFILAYQNLRIPKIVSLLDQNPSKTLNSSSLVVSKAPYHVFFSCKEIAPSKNWQQTEKTTPIPVKLRPLSLWVLRSSRWHHVNRMRLCHWVSRYRCGCVQNISNKAVKQCQKNMGSNHQNCSLQNRYMTDRYPLFLYEKKTHYHRVGSKHMPNDEAFFDRSDWESWTLDQQEQKSKVLYLMLYFICCGALCVLNL